MAVMPFASAAMQMPPTSQRSATSARSQVRWTAFCIIALTAISALVVTTTSLPAAGSGLVDGLAAYDAGDLRAAATAWREAADQGDLDAMVALAGLYEAGDGVPASPAMARQLYRRAAARGHPVAQLNLGDSYSRGTATDLPRAYLWLSLAAAQGRTWPAARLRDITARMSATELSEGERLLTNWRDR